MKFFGLLCFWIFAMSSQCQAETWNCEYGNDYATYRYACILRSGSQSTVDVTNIDGRHQAGKSNEDVKVLLNWYSNLKTFSSIFCQIFHNLEHIKAQDTKIESIDENSIYNCKSLVKIELRKNGLSDLPEKFLAENPKLTHVDICHNNLRTLPKNFFVTQNHLERLRLEYNLLSSLPSKIFQPVVNLQFLNIDSNKLQFIDPEWFANLKNLKLLSLGENEFSEVPVGAFQSLENLEDLYLSGNKIKSLNPGNFEGLQNLQELNLSQNKISDLPRGVFVPLKNLERLYLSSNKLTVIHSDSFKHIDNKLTWIELNDNEITAIDEKIVDNAAIKDLYMTNNLCCSKNIHDRSKIKPQLRNCFNNYQPRCGRTKTATGDIISGSQVTRGSFIWIAAVERTSGRFLCTGTLVDSKKVVTAASCIQAKNVASPIHPNDIEVVLGAHDLNNPNENGRKAFKVQSIHVHHSWNPNSERFDSDIAVLILDQAVIQQHIEPACLIDSESTIDSISIGIIIGFQKSEDGQKNIATAIDTSIHKNRDCAQINPNIHKVSTFQTFCGVTKNGSCNIGIGSGLFVQKQDGAFYLRGLASTLIGSGADQCSTDSVTIFTNILLYTDWINGIEV